MALKKQVRNTGGLREILIISVRTYKEFKYFLTITDK